MSGKFEFDQASVDALKPGEKEWVAWDESLAGFGVRILPSGTKSWIVSARMRQQDGKVRSRRIRIARCTDMNLEEARTAARKVLSEAVGDGGEEAAVESLPAEGVDKQASQDGDEALEDRAAEPPPNDATTEEAPGAGDGAGTAAVSVTPSGDRFDTKTGEILSEGEGEHWDPDEDLGELAATGQGPDASREPEVVPGGQADDGQTDTALAGAIAKVTGSGTTDRYAEIPETAGPADRSGPRVETEGGTEAERGRAAPGGADAAGGYPDADVDSDESGAPGRGEGEGRTGEAETAPPRPGMASRVIDTAAGMAGKAVKRGKEMVSGSRKGTSAGEERAEAARDEPEAGPPASGESSADKEDGSEGSGQPELDARRKRDAEAEEESGAGNRLSEESVTNLARNLDGIRGVVDRIEAWSAKMGPHMEMLSGSTAVIAVDRRRGRRRVAKAVLALAVMTALGIAGGAALQSRLPLLPQADPTLGWKDHLWKHYGNAFRDCFQQAKQAESGYADCTIKVRGR